MVVRSSSTAPPPPLVGRNRELAFLPNCLTDCSPKGVTLPVGVSVFPDELDAAPRIWTEKAHSNLIHYHQLLKGGHFVAWNQPQCSLKKSIPRFDRAAQGGGPSRRNCINSLQPRRFPGSVVLTMLNAHLGMKGSVRARTTTTTSAASPHERSPR
jgi:hypothetical protein